MSRKKEQYTYIASRKLYQKKRKGPDGKYICLYGRTPQELSLKLEQFDAEMAAGLEFRENPLFEDYALQWLELKRPHISYGTASGYEWILRRHALPPMKGKRLRSIVRSDIQAAINLAQEKSKSTTRKLFLLYSQIFKSAMQDHIITSSPCLDIDVGGKTQGKRVALTQEQISVLLDAIAGTRADLFYRIALYSGLRREEILGLQWDCVDLGEVPTITVKRALRHIRNRPVCSETLKSKAAARTIAIPSVLADALREEKAKSISDYVISNSSGGPLSEKQLDGILQIVHRRSVAPRKYVYYKNGKKIVYNVDPQKPHAGRRVPATIDFPATPHVLRHTYATMLIASGMDVKSVQYLMGHETAKMTLDIYTDFAYNRPQDISPSIEKAFSNSK